MPYFVYIVECSDKSLYCGYTTNLAQRLADHNSSDKGAKYTRGRRPVVLMYWEEFNSLSDALKREHKIKTLDKDAKNRLIKSKSI